MRRPDRKYFKSQYDRYIFLMLLALEVLMSFTFLGYIHVPPISITYAFIPILAAGVLLGPVSATAVGAVFGLCSMYKASAYYVAAGDRIFSPFMSGSPLASLLLSVGARTLFGLLIGVLFWRVKKTKHPALGFGMIALLSRTLHSVIVYAVMNLCFPEYGVNLISRILARPGLNNILVDVVCVLVTEIAWQAHHSDHIKKIRSYVDLNNRKFALKGGSGKQTHRRFLIFALIDLFGSVISAVYFVRRTSYMLDVHDLELDSAVTYDLMHLQVQFLMAVLSLSALVLILFIILYQYLLYREYLKQLDGLTGIMGRGMFWDYCGRLFRDDGLFGQKGCFLLLDMDHFKKINDEQGHPVGDLVLQKVAEHLQEIFCECGQSGRIGGDEFAVMMEQAVPDGELRELLDQLQSRAKQILSAPVTISIGACYFSYPEDLEHIYEETDKLLYEAKIKGRSCYVIGGEI